MKKFSELVLVFLSIATISACNPFKITDPSDPRFDPAQFKFEDYSTELDLQNALTLIFPVGTPREKIEQILMDNAQLQAGFTEGENGNYFVTYFDSVRSMDDLGIFDAGIPQAQFEYNTNDRVVFIKSHIIDGKTPPKFLTGFTKDLIQKGEKR